MKHWRYGIVEHNTGKNIWFGIHEVYLNDKGMVEAITENAIKPFGETAKELLEDMEMMLSDAKKYSVLSEEKLEKRWETKSKNISS